jgi:hypothetical protein
MKRLKLTMTLWRYYGYNLKAAWYIAGDRVVRKQKDDIDWGNL